MGRRWSARPPTNHCWRHQSQVASQACDKANRTEGGKQTAVQTSVTEIPTLIRILLWTDPLAGVVVVTAVVAVVAAGAVRTRRGGRSDCRSPIAETWAVIAAAVAGVTRDWTARATGSLDSRVGAFSPRSAVRTPTRLLRWRRRGQAKQPHRRLALSDARECFSSTAPGKEIKDFHRVLLS